MTNNITLLRDLAREINAEHAAATGSIEFMVKTAKDWQAHVIRAGELLMEAKKQYRHGKWGDWIDNNLQISQRTAQTYMQVAKNVDRLDQNRSAADFSLRQVLKQITDMSVADTPQATPSSGAVISHQVEEMRDAWDRGGPETRHAFRERIAEPAPTDSRVANSATRAPTTETHIFERMFGPLSGQEWARLADGIRWGLKRGVPLPDEFRKLCAFHKVPLAELEAVQ